MMIINLLGVLQTILALALSRYLYINEIIMEGAILSSVLLAIPVAMVLSIKLGLVRNNRLVILWLGTVKCFVKLLRMITKTFKYLTVLSVMSLSPDTIVTLACGYIAYDTIYKEFIHKELGRLKVHPSGRDKVKFTYHE